MYKPRRPNDWERYRAQLAAYAQAPVNYDITQALTPAHGWRTDTYRVELPAEAPGPPAPAGSFAAAQEVLYRYAFPPPSLLTGYFDPRPPLAERVMVLRAHFLAFSFTFGVRIVDVVDGPQPGPEQVWGYGYRTLEGHFERGQINFRIHKNLTTGAVSFHIHAVSQTGAIRNPFYWLGFKVFGRTLQRRFARQSLARMRGLVAEALAQPRTMAAPVGY